jgi:glycosyltransferase involved in cell wall biosynthesis
MRICLVSGEYPPMQGGVGDYTRELGRALVQMGHAVDVVTSRQAETLGVQEQTPKVDERDPRVQPIVERWNWRSWARVLRTVQELQSDVLHIQYQTAAYGMHPAINFLPLRLRREQRRPRTVVTFHDVRVPYLFPKAGPLRRWVNLWLARYSDAAIATNEEDFRVLAHWPLGRCVVRQIPIGSNIQPHLSAGYDRAVWRSKLGVGPDEALLCYFGFLNESKGGETLFRALAELVQRGQPVKLLMVGGQVGASDPTNMTYLRHVQALIAELGLTERVLWTGFTEAEQVSGHFQASDICVLPYHDGASYRRGSFMAALAHGLPIVSTQPRVGVTSLRDGQNILLVAPDDVTATAAAAERLIAAPELRAQLRDGALELAQQFTWDSIATKTVQLYEEVPGR